MKPSAVVIKKGHDVNGRDLCVEGDSIFEVILPNFINDLTEKLGHTLLSRLITGVVIEMRFVGGLCTNAKNCCGIVSNYLVIEWETSRACVFGTMVCFVLDSLGEDGCDGVNPVQLVVGDDREQWEKGFLDG
jgi:hypothetical protein